MSAGWGSQPCIAASLTLPARLLLVKERVNAPDARLRVSGVEALLPAVKA